MPLRSDIRTAARAGRATSAAVLTAILTFAIAGGSASGDAASVEQTPMRWHMQSGNPHMSVIGDGARARLTRTSNGISYSIDTHGLRAGHAYTVWVLVINNPAACAASPCAPTDILKNPATDSQVIYGTGHVVGSSGRTGFGGHVARGPLPEGWLPDQGLEDPLGADIHLVLNDHGPKLASFMPGMIRTYRAGCTDASLPALFPPSAIADGEPGPNTCRLWQVAVFE